MQNYEIGEIVKINKWSLSFYPFECYDPSNSIFPKQHRLFGEYVFLGVITELDAEMAYIWVLNLEKNCYIYYKDMQKCQD
jgi:hypothetical protein